MAKVIRGLILAVFAGLIVTTGCGGGGSSPNSTSSSPNSTTAVTATPASLNFSTVAVGSKSAPQTVTLSNSPGNAAVNISGISASTNFSVSNDCKSSLSPGSSCHIIVTFAPPQVGTQTGNLTVTETGSVITVSLAGTGGTTDLPYSIGQGGMVPPNTWTTVQTNGFPAEIVGFDATVYASSIKRHIVLGKYHHYGSEPNYCMDGWSWDENRWDILDCSDAFHNEHSMEAGHTVGDFVYMPSRNAIVYWGGLSGSNQAEMAYHTWWWDVGARVGRDKLSSSRPGSILTSAMAYDQSRDKAIFYPDANSNAEIYDPAANTWSTPAVSGTAPPNGLTFATLEWDSSDGKTYVFGGGSGNNCSSGLTLSNSVYTFNPGNNSWTELNIAPDPVNGSPAPRWHAGFAYDPDDNTFLLAGGQYCSAGNYAGLTDTWKLDPVAMKWIELSPASNYVLHSPDDSPFQKLRYDPDHHGFVMILPSYDNQASAGGSWGNYAARVWLYCPGSCSNVGTKTVAYNLPSGTLNRNGGQPVSASNQTWAQDTALAGGASGVYAGWIETGLPFYGGMCEFHHPYVSYTSNGSSWSDLGADCSAMDSAAASGLERDSFQPSLAVINGTLWATWSGTDSGVSPIGVFAKSWNGSGWTGGRIGFRVSATYDTQGFSQLTSAGGAPVIGFIEQNRTLYPGIGMAFVDQYSGGAWKALGGALNVNQSQGRTEFMAITSDGTNPWACWTEELLQASQSNTAPGWGYVTPAQLYCAHWNPSTSMWSTTGSLNRSASSWASDVTATYAGGKLYVAWTERTTAGNPNLYVESYNPSTSTWSAVGSGAVNNDTTAGWVFHPRLATDGTNLYLSWEEQWNSSSPGSNSLGQPTRLYVSQWNGSAWSSLGPALNMNPLSGSVLHSSLAVANGYPVALWNEIQIGQLQQTYMKQWNGSSWVPVTR